jgi:hypothetical protein
LFVFIAVSFVTASGRQLPVSPKQKCRSHQIAAASLEIVRILIRASSVSAQAPWISCPVAGPDFGSLLMLFSIVYGLHRPSIDFSVPRLPQYEVDLLDVCDLEMIDRITRS